MNNADLLLSNSLGILESELEDTLGSLTGDQLDGLNDTWDNNVLNTGVFSLSVLTDENGIDVVVWGLVALDGLARTDVGEKVEGTTESQVEGDVTLSDWGGQWTLQGDQVLLDRLNGGIWNGGLSVLEDWSDIDGLPLDWGLIFQSATEPKHPPRLKEIRLTLAAAKMALTDFEISGPIPSPSMKETV